MKVMVLQMETFEKLMDKTETYYCHTLAVFFRLQNSFKLHLYYLDLNRSIYSKKLLNTGISNK